MSSPALAQHLVDAALLLAVEGDDGETLSGDLLAPVIDALGPFLSSPFVPGRGTPPTLLPDLEGRVGAPLAGAVRKTFGLVFPEEGSDARRDADDDAWRLNRAAVEAWRESLKPFGLERREAEFHGPGPRV